MKNDATVIGLISFAHGMSHFYQLLLAPLFPFIKDELGVSYAALGFLVALFYTLSGLLQPLAGFVVDRYGARSVLLIGVSFFVASTLVMGLSTSYAMLALGAALGGIGNSVFHPADFAILSARVSSARLGYAFSAHGVVGYVGYAVAPVFGVAIGAAFGWQAALRVGALLGIGLLALLLLNSRHLDITERARPAKTESLKTEASVLFAAPVVLCFAYFTVFAAGLAGLQSFGVSAMVEQFRVAATAASSALTAYLVSAALGILAGGFVAARTPRHDYVAAAGMAVSALAILAIAMNLVPGAALAAALAVSGFASGVVAPSRDLIVRASTPPGAAGRVFGFVYSGLDVGAFATPVFYGWMLDTGVPHAVFYVVFAFLFAATLTVLLIRVANPLSVQHPQ
ncbi:MAG TPA: MFS transporter [Burkholderiales bacterium]|nr:MFS transporter [Burkholderiales bacterium]